MIRFSRLSPPALLLLAACRAGPDYEPPRFEAPERFLSQQVLADLDRGSAGGEVPANWWEGFSDTLLDRLVQDALKRNHGIAAAVMAVREARADLALAGAGDEPRLDLEAGAGVEESQLLEQGGEQQSGRDASLALALAWPLDLSGRTRRAVEAARAGVAASEARLQDLELEVSARVAREYLRLRGNQRQLELLRQSVGLQEKTLAIVRSRFEAGLSPELDLRRAETSVQRLRAGIPPLEEALLNSRNRLANLTGRFPGACEEILRERAPIPTYRGRFIEVVPLAVLRRRPDIRGAEARLRQAVAGVGVAAAAYNPALELAGGIGIGSLKREGASVVNELVASLGALVSRSLHQGGARRARLEGARARAEAALAGYRQVLLDATQEVEATLAAIAASRRRQRALEKAVTASATSFRQAEDLYQQGLISFLDVVDAQRVLASAEQELAAERTAYATRIATLFRVLGSGAEAYRQRPPERM